MAMLFKVVVTTESPDTKARYKFEFVANGDDWLDALNTVLEGAFIGGMKNKVVGHTVKPLGAGTLGSDYIYTGASKEAVKEAA
jgi:hypothetical protein